MLKESSPPVDQLIQKLNVDITAYKKHTRNEGPHSKKGKFYKEMFLKRKHEKMTLVYALVVEFLETEIHVEYEDAIELFLQDHPENTHFDVIIDVYATGENQTDSSDLADILLIGFYSLLREYMFA